MEQYLLLGYCSCLKGRRKGNSCRRHGNSHSSSVGALWLNVWALFCDLCAEVESGFHLVPAAEHLKGTGREQALSRTDGNWAVTQTYQGLNRQKLVACYTGSSSESPTDINNIIYIYAQADTFAEGFVPTLQELRHHFPQEQVQ